ncbi:MAG: DUF924 family protein [Gammaproteobacteria bacterium]
MKHADEILHYWFGHVEETVLPSENRTRIWFGGNKEVDEEIKAKFGDDWQKAVNGQCVEWENDPHGMLGLIILFDQFTRHIHRQTPASFAQDQKALDLCLRGIQKEFDHLLSLIERVFFYFPLMHSESLEMQATAVRAYQILVNLAFPETRAIYENFLAYAIKHYEVIKHFGRFPHRNLLLGRMSTAEELEFLKTAEAPFNE